MAKKKMAGKVSGRGKKQCPSCDEINGARSAVCKKCGHAFQIKTGANSKGKHDGFTSIRAVMAFANECGGIEKARTQIASLTSLLAATGGTKGALEALRQVEEIKKLKG